jgi:group II intron reverse transcriptase/maturase
MEPTEPQYSTATKLARIAWLSARDPAKKFDGLMHHFNAESMAACFHELDGRKATGSDRVSKDDYGESLAKNLEVLVERMKKMAYRPGPVREVRIPKEGKPGSFRPLGIGNFEDKLVQKMTAKVLESIYEPMFLDCSYGFRPGRGCHDAIRDLNYHLFSHEVEAVIDVDLANYFGTIRPGVADEILREKIGDDRFLRYIQRLFKAGVLAGGELTISDEGVPQGSPASPVIANIVAHHVIDTWFETVVKLHCRGSVAMFRYCDDLVVCCQYAMDAVRVHKALGLRLRKYGLQLNEEKTRLVNFSKMRQTKGTRQGSFDFLGFTFYLGKSRKGTVIPKLKTSGKRFKSKLKRVTDWARANRSKVRLPELWAIFRSKLRGHIAYYGVSFNQRRVDSFIRESTNIVFKWLNRRGGRRKMSWAKFQLFIKLNPLPANKTYHKLFTLQTSQ